MCSTSSRNAAIRAVSAPASRATSSLRRRAAASARQAVARVPSSRSLFLADEGVEHVELIRRSAEPTLLELARHRDQPLGRSGQILPRDRAAPGVRPRTTVGEDAPCENEPRLVLRPQLRQRFEITVVEEAVRDVELSFDVGLRPGLPDGGGIALGAEQQADRLSKDRLAGAGLAAEDVQPVPELQLSLADEDEVLDPEASQHRGDGRPAAPTAHLSETDALGYELPKLCR